MISPSRRGTLWRTASPAQTQAHGAAAGATYVTALDQLIPGGTAVLDLDEVPLAVATDICSRSRGLGVHLAVAARPGADVPYPVRRNLAYGE